MNVQPMHPNFKMPTRGTAYAGAWDIYMPTAGTVWARVNHAAKVQLGFAAEVPEGHVALLLPRSGAGANKGLALNNTCGVIDSDYRGEWVAALRVHNGEPVSWAVGDRLLQFLIVPVAQITLNQVEKLAPTFRGEGGFGSTGQ